MSAFFHSPLLPSVLPNETGHFTLYNFKFAVIRNKRCWCLTDNFDPCSEFSDVVSVKVETHGTFLRTKQLLCRGFQWQRLSIFMTYSDLVLGRCIVYYPTNLTSTSLQGLCNLTKQLRWDKVCTAMFKGSCISSMTLIYSYHTIDPLFHPTQTN